MQPTSKLGWILAFIIVSTICHASDAADIKMISLPSIPGLTRTDIYYIEPDYKPVACLVMCPGINGNGTNYLTRRDLQAFAKNNKLALVGLSFASDQDSLDQNKGYYTASMGAGKLLLDGIDKYIATGIPVLLYGFSGGAHFVSSFEEAYPQRVVAWCAYTAAWWDNPKASQDNPPGIIACGKLDDQRFGPSFQYFQAGRKLGKPWCWISLDSTEHLESDKLFSFVELYFGSFLKVNGISGAWYDLETKKQLDEKSSKYLDSAVWLPNNTEEAWSIINSP